MTPLDHIQYRTHTNTSIQVVTIIGELLLQRTEFVTTHVLDAEAAQEWSQRLKDSIRRDIQRNLYGDTLKELNRLREAVDHLTHFCGGIHGSEKLRNDVFDRIKDVQKTME